MRERGRTKWIVTGRGKPFLTRVAGGNAQKTWKTNEVKPKVQSCRRVTKRNNSGDKMRKKKE